MEMKTRSRFHHNNNILDVTDPGVHLIAECPDRQMGITGRGRQGNLVPPAGV